MLSRYYDSIFSPTFEFYDALRFFNDVEKAQTKRHSGFVDDEGVKIELPGVKPEDVTVEVEGRILKVSGKSRHGKEFKHSYSLGSDVDDSTITAQLKDGLLSIKLTRKSGVSRKIEVSC